MSPWEVYKCESKENVRAQTFLSTSLKYVVVISNNTYRGKVSEVRVAVGETAMEEGLETEMAGHFMSTDVAHFFSARAVWEFMALPHPLRYMLGKRGVAEARRGAMGFRIFKKI